MMPKEGHVDIQVSASEHSCFLVNKNIGKCMPNIFHCKSHKIDGPLIYKLFD